MANPNQINDSFGWHMQYLTIIGLSLAASTFAVGLLADLTLSPTLFRIKNTLSIASAPMEVLISILYWALRTVRRAPAHFPPTPLTLDQIDPGLVMPDWAPVLSLKTDFSFHAIPSVALVVDLLFFSPPYAISALPALGLSSFIALAYWFWTELCYSKNGFYAYPIFEQLDTPGRAALFSGSAVVMAVSTLSLSWLYGKVNGEEMDVKRKPR